MLRPIFNGTSTSPILMPLTLFWGLSRAIISRAIRFGCISSATPSSGKTELLMSVFECEETFFLSDFTPAALISGYCDDAITPPFNAMDTRAPNESSEGEENSEGETKQEVIKKVDYSLLPKLNGMVVVTKDFSLIHDKPSETRAQILSILRDVYDGYAQRRWAIANRRVSILDLTISLA